MSTTIEFLVDKTMELPAGTSLLLTTDPTDDTGAIISGSTLESFPAWTALQPKGAGFVASNSADVEFGVKYGTLLLKQSQDALVERSSFLRDVTMVSGYESSDVIAYQLYRGELD